MNSKFIRFLKAIWANKNSIFAIITTSVSILLANFLVIEGLLMPIEWCAEHRTETYIIGAAIAAFMLFTDIRCIVTKYGVETVEEFAERLEEKRANSATKLNKEQKTELKTQLSSFKKGLVDIQDKITELENKTAELKKLIDSGNATDNDVTAYKVALEEANQLALLETTYENKIKETKEQI